MDEMAIVKDLLYKKSGDIEFFIHGTEVEVKDRIFNYHFYINIILKLIHFKNYPIKGIFRCNSKGNCFFLRKIPIYEKFSEKIEEKNAKAYQR